MSESTDNPDRSSRRRSRDRSPLRKCAQRLELLGGILLCTLIAITPWMYGTTEPWSKTIMNLGSYLTGVVFLVVAILIRMTRGSMEVHTKPRDSWPKILFLVLNLLTLAFCAAAWWNARASYYAPAASFTYYEHIPWLPTTYDRELTLDTLLMLLACFSAFWSLRYWLWRGWERTLNRSDTPPSSAVANRRFAAILWVISLNGMLLGIQGILQRLSGSPKLLWMRMSWWGDPSSCFGPFSYRGNAVDYLNLLWPVALGFWWILSRERRRTQGSSRLVTDGPEMMLLPAVVMTAAGSFATLSRGGIVVATGLLLAALVSFAFQKGASKAARIGIGVLILAVLGVVSILGWGELIQRFKEDNLAELGGRLEIYRNARQMADDYPLYGTGPGSFRSVYHLYRSDPSVELRHGYLHDDWMETRVTFGWVGLGLIMAQLALIVWWVLTRGRAPVPSVFVICFGLSLAGCLVHAKYDLPFQTYSIVYTFVALVAILTTVTPARK